MVQIGCAEMTMDKASQEITVVTHIPGAKLMEKISLVKLLRDMGVEWSDVRYLVQEQFDNSIPDTDDTRTIKIDYGED